jgi:hypothetical protein
MSACARVKFFTRAGAGWSDARDRGRLRAIRVRVHGAAKQPCDVARSAVTR